MASRESKTISGFPRRIFSSLRRSKKSVRLRHNLDGSGPPASFTVEDLDKTQNNNATIDFEATIPLENPNETNRADNNEDSEQSSLLPSPVPSYRVINEDVSVLENIPPELFGNLSTPVVRRFELGGLMSASADSGIDCSLLQSEKNSPEQFVAFTRREAERIRQKQQILGFNESLLEPLNEVDSRSSSDTENIVRSSSELNDDATDCNGASTNENEGENQKDGYLHAHHKDSNCDYVHLSNNSEKCPNESTSTETNLVYPLPKPHTGFKDSGDYVYLLEENLESIHHTDEQSITDSRDQIANDHYEIDLISNKTDETKSAEARLRMHSNSEKSVSIATNPPIVDPIPIRLTNLATQRALVPTPCPDSLFENETSAFAKCKSLKRSVSDAGLKGFFGRFRHRSKDNVSLISEADSLSSHNSSSSREKLKKKVKKFSLKKGKDKLRKRHISDIILHSAAHIADFTYGVDSSKETEKSSDAKELIVSDDAVMSNDRACSRQSTVDKVGQQMIKSDLSRSVSPLQSNSIESFTKSMCKMTSALQSSSTESIACICDCKDRDSKAACCEKRKTPTPPLSVICELTADNLFTSEKCGNYLNSETTGSDHVSQSSRHICCSTKSTKHTVYQNVSGSNKPGSSGVLNDASWFECSDESDDDNSKCSCYSDCDTCTSSQDSSGENDDTLDCSNLCIASPETGKLPLNDDDFSDSESYFNEPASNDDSINQDPEEDVMQNELSQFDLNSSIQSFNVSQDIFAKVNSRVNNFSMTRSFNSPMSTSQSGASNNAGISSGPQSSEFSVSFHEVDFENGEVMYMENDLGDGDEFTEETVRPIKAFAHLSHLCATPVSSPRTEASRSVESSVNNYPINRLPSGMFRSSRSHGALNNQFLLSKECVSETNFNMSHDESFTNVSFEGSFAENSFSVHSKHGDARNSQKSHVNQRQDVESLHHSFSSSRRSEKASFHNLTFDEAFSRSVDHDMRLPWLHASFSGLNDSYVLQKGASSNSHLNRSQSAVMSPNGSFMRNNPRYSSFHRYSPCSSPLDLSMNKGGSPLDLSINTGRQLQTLVSPEMKKVKSKKWMDSHVGQVFSPARRALQKKSWNQ
ncbi:hypothetical protein DPMN_057874 [Dreissena polymorpha]|uniref:Uncharacterized protein n=1 Tax=Dreissena polymorpha TaxID=45954 RepID=A0A9D4C137_DREPO|nr:hypothetical protein DPMN_057874 [Dreissena polymorpha]